MSCKVSQYNICQLIQETWKEHKLLFPNSIDISNDTFQYKVYRFNELVQDSEVLPNNNEVILPSVELPKGCYNHELIWITNNGTYLVFQGSLEFTNKGKNCNCNDEKQIVIENSTDIINVDITFVGGGGVSNEVVLEDSNGEFWKLKIDTKGAIITEKLI